MAFVERESLVSLDEPADLVITSGGGAPLDSTFYQAIKGISTASSIVKPGGAILLCAALSEGVGSASFEKLIRECRDPRDFEARLDDDRFFAIDQWMVQHLCQAHRRARVLLYTDAFPPAAVAELLVEPAASPAAGVAAGLAGRGPDARIAVLPQGPYVLATVRGAMRPLGGNPLDGRFSARAARSAPELRARASSGPGECAGLEVQQLAHGLDAFAQAHQLEQVDQQRGRGAGVAQGAVARGVANAEVGADVIEVVATQLRNDPAGEPLGAQHGHPQAAAVRGRRGRVRRSRRRSGRCGPRRGPTPARSSQRRKPPTAGRAGGASATMASSMPVRSAMARDSGPGGRMSVWNRPAARRRDTRTAPISRIAERAGDRPVVSRSTTTNSARDERHVGDGRLLGRPDVPRLQPIGERHLGAPQGRGDDPARKGAVDRGVEREDRLGELLDADGGPAAGARAPRPA